MIADYLGVIVTKLEEPDETGYYYRVEINPNAPNYKGKTPQFIDDEARRILGDTFNA
jgi:hypothetical protein